MNLVEMIVPDDEMSFNQPCYYGNLVEDHSVYCHNTWWDGAPRKCHRSWYRGRNAEFDVQDEACYGFMPNPDYGGAFLEPPGDWGPDWTMED